MTLIRAVRMLLDQHRLLRQQQDVLEGYQLLIDLYRQDQLQLLRDKQDLIAGWLLSIEKPEIDMRETLVAFDVELGYRIAALEEHIV